MKHVAGLPSVLRWIQLVLKSTNPRDVAYIFRDYVRRLHAKALPNDPNLSKISIACGQVKSIDIPICGGH